MKPRPKKHLADGSCKAGKGRERLSHRRFVELDYDACLTCARVCGCEECAVLERDFGSRKKGST
jgi:hypothetical protein